MEGLRKAARDEDVTFAIIGLHKSTLGFANNPKVTTGRIFYQGGRINIIFGLVQNKFNERVDRRLAPFTPGSRQKVLGEEWQLLFLPGQKGFSLTRNDWAAFSDEWQAPVSEQGVPSKQSTPTERLTTLKEQKELGLISEEEYRGKRLEILNGL